MKPGDFFLGIIDFFSILIPGAIVTFFLIKPTSTFLLERYNNWPTIVWGSAEGWVVFLVGAYVLGHLIFAMSSLLDYFYDRYFVLYKRAKKDILEIRKAELEIEIDNCEDEVNRNSLKGEKTQIEEYIKEPEINKDKRSKVKKELEGVFPHWKLRRKRCYVAWKEYKFENDLLSAAVLLKLKQLKNRELGFILADNITLSKISNTFNWANAFIHINTPTISIEADRLMAQSKFFRSMVIVFFLAIIALIAIKISYGSIGFVKLIILIVLLLLILLLCFYRYLDLRYKATKRIYEYFIASSYIGSVAKAKASSRLNNPVWQRLKTSSLCRAKKQPSLF